MWKLFFESENIIMLDTKTAFENILILITLTLKNQLLMILVLLINQLIYEVFNQVLHVLVSTISMLKDISQEKVDQMVDLNNFLIANSFDMILKDSHDQTKNYYQTNLEHLRSIYDPLVELKIIKPYKQASTN